jgi:hypothetical protein
MTPRDVRMALPQRIAIAVVVGLVLAVLAGFLLRAASAGSRAYVVVAAGIEAVCIALGLGETAMPRVVRAVFMMLSPSRWRGLDESLKRKRDSVLHVDFGGVPVRQSVGTVGAGGNVTGMKVDAVELSSEHDRDRTWMFDATAWALLRPGAPWGETPLGLAERDDGPRDQHHDRFVLVPSLFPSEAQALAAGKRAVAERGTLRLMLVELELREAIVFDAREELDWASLSRGDKSHLDRLASLYECNVDIVRLASPWGEMALIFSEAFGNTVRIVDESVAQFGGGRGGGDSSVFLEHAGQRADGGSRTERRRSKRNLAST